MTADTPVLTLSKEAHMCCWAIQGEAGIHPALPASEGDTQFLIL